MHDCSLHKALPMPEEPAIWRPLENPYLTEICEGFTRQVQAEIQETQDALLEALNIAALGAPVLRKAIGDKPIRDYAPEDWLALVDTILGRHFSPDALSMKAVWLAFRAFLAGRVNATADRRPDIAPHAALLDLLGRLRFKVQPPLHAWQFKAWEWAKARIGIHLRSVTEAARARIAGTITAHVMEHGLSSRGKLQQRLFDDFGTMNRDWRRIAITEAGEIANKAYLGEFKPGTKVKRLEAYEGACPFCEKINGMVFTWVDAPLDESYGWTHIWPGKTNEGRSMSPRKQTPDGLVERTESELWWPAEGLQHPNCRGRWVALPSDTLPEGADPEFMAWVNDELAKV